MQLTIRILSHTADLFRQFYNPIHSELVQNAKSIAYRNNVIESCAWTRTDRLANMLLLSSVITLLRVPLSGGRHFPHSGREGFEDEVFQVFPERESHTLDVLKKHAKT